MTRFIRQISSRELIIITSGTRSNSKIVRLVMTLMEKVNTQCCSLLDIMKALLPIKTKLRVKSGISDHIMLKH